MYYNLIYIKEICSVFFRFIYIFNYKYGKKSSADTKTNIKKKKNRIYIL